MAYINRPPCNMAMYDDILYPPIEIGPQRFAISRRNKWMVTEADVVVAYIQHEEYGGASAMWKQAKRNKKRIVAYHKLGK